MRLIVPLTLGSTKIVWPVAFAKTLATDSISAFENDKVTLPSSGTAIFGSGRLDCAYAKGMSMLSPATQTTKSWTKRL